MYFFSWKWFWKGK